MKKRMLSLALCLVLVVGLFSGLTVNASAGIFEDFEAKKKEIAEKIIKEKIKQLKEEFEIPDLDTDAIISSFTTAATSGDFGVNNCLHWKVTSTFTSKTLTITGTGAMPDFDFPNGNLAPWWNYEALGMNAISEIDFDIKGNLKRVIIGDGVTNVGDYALFCLPAATQVTLPESVTRIGRYGIAMCSALTGMSIPKSVTEIGDFGLAGNGLTAVTLPDGLQSLGRGAFDTCASLTNTTLPAAITAVPGKCFADCTKLLNVKYAGTVTAIGDLAFESCKSLVTAPIPETVTEIGASTGCTALTDVTLPAGVAAIPDGCFQGCIALKDMKLPGTVTSVGHNTFTGCTALKDVRCYGAPPTVEPAGAAEHSFEPAIVTIHYNPDPVYGWTLEADGTWQGYKVSSKGACLHTGYGTHENTVPATCGEAGRTETICDNCGDVVSTKEIPATGAHTWDNGKVTTEPTETTPGVRTYTCTICGLTKEEVIPPTGGSTVCPGGPSCPSYGFRDVAGPSDWSHEGIDYCVRRSLMVGTGVGTFSPDMAFSRAQIVQILYNLSGDKTDYGNYYLPFTDVAPGDWFYEAVAWAYANDIVAGTRTDGRHPLRLHGQVRTGIHRKRRLAQHLPRRRQRRQLGLYRHVVGRGQWPDLRHGIRRRVLPRAAGQRHARAGLGHHHALLPAHRPVSRHANCITIRPGSRTLPGFFARAAGGRRAENVRQQRTHVPDLQRPEQAAENGSMLT